MQSDGYLSEQQEQTADELLELYATKIAPVSAELKKKSK